MEMKHTPGPWSVFDDLDGEETYGIDSASGEAVVFYGSNKNEGIRNIANARLIAAAPELLEALQKIASIENKDIGSDWEEIEEARAIANLAISNLTGNQP